MPDTPLAALEAFIAACGSQSAAAKKLRVSPQFIGQIVHGTRAMPESMLTKLGWKKVVSLKKLSA